MSEAPAITPNRFFIVAFMSSSLRAEVTQASKKHEGIGVKLKMSREVQSRQNI
jgi:hypothetical protein